MWELAGTEGDRTATDDGTGDKWPGVIDFLETPIRIAELG